MNEAIERAAELIDQADAIVIAAGAGMGVDSGLPDFRGSDGFWYAYPALGHARMIFAEVASPRTFRSEPRLAWGFYGHRLELYRETVPHSGFAILQRWARRMSHGAFVFTSNVDGQFQKAGFDAGCVHECHGSIHALQCLGPCCDRIWPADDLTPSIDRDACRWLGELQTCPLCGGLLRPNILMFGDGAWLAHRSDQTRAALDAWLARVRRPVVIELGAGTSIPSVRYFGNEVVHLYGGRLIRISPREAQVGSMDAGLRTGALAGLRAIDERLSG